MLVTFSSKADMDVIMMEKDARQVLTAAGKITGTEIPERGIFTVEQIDTALHNLQMAIGQESATMDKHPDDQDDDEDDYKPKAKGVVLLAQRASPLMQMMRKSRQANAPVMWETGSGW